MNKAPETITPTHKHKHYDIKAQFVDVCANGSWKVYLQDNTRPTPKQRKPKNYSISKFEQSQLKYEDDAS